MRLLTLHRILLGSAVAVCLIYAVRVGLTYAKTGTLAPLLYAGLAMLAAIGFGLYLRAIRSW